jgi:hypothetical protein
VNFAHFEAVANSMVLNHLANVQIGISGVLVPGIFRKPSSTDSLGVGAVNTSPSVQVASNAVMAEPVGKQISIAGVPYVIVEAEPDGTGMTTLIVECTQ